MTDEEKNDAVRDTWQEVIDAAWPATRSRVAAIVDQHAPLLADQFYAAMMAHPASSTMLDHDTVNTRLRASMQRWLRQLFISEATIDEWMATQRRTGEVHARVGVSMDLIARGALVLKRSITGSLAAERLATDPMCNAVQYVYELIDVAVDTMNMAYASNARRIDRSDEAYRMMFFGRDLRAERERQRSQLMEWAHQILTRYYWDAEAEPPVVGQGFEMSQFGLWIKHKASVLFDDAPEIARIKVAIEAIEDELVPGLSRARAGQQDARPVVAAINARIDEIKALLGSMFDRFIDTQDGRDGVTRLLNRRYLPAIAKREIDMAGRARGAFAALLVDIDHFSRVRAAPGMGTADMVLAHVADALLDHLRAGDFVFRVGDDRFCVLLVETARADVLAVADGLRARIAATTLPTAAPVATAVTASIGVAPYDGHPDYQRLLERAEDALRQAKAQGRNRCVMVP